MMMPMMQRLFNVPSTFIQMQHFMMIDKDGNEYMVASGQTPNADGQNKNYSISDWDFKKGINY